MRQAFLCEVTTMSGLQDDIIHRKNDDKPDAVLKYFSFWIKKMFVFSSVAIHSQQNRKGESMLFSHHIFVQRQAISTANLYAT